MKYFKRRRGYTTAANHVRRSPARNVMISSRKKTKHSTHNSTETMNKKWLRHRRRSSAIFARYWTTVRSKQSTLSEHILNLPSELSDYHSLVVIESVPRVENSRIYCEFIYVYDDLRALLIMFFPFKLSVSPNSIDVFHDGITHWERERENIEELKREYLFEGC